MSKPRWWDEIKRMTEWGHEWSSCRTDGLHLLLKKDLMFLDKIARWAGQNSGEYLQPSQRSPVLQIWWGEDWFLSPIFSHFKPYWSILLCSFLSFFCSFPFLLWRRKTTCFTMKLYSEHHMLMRSCLDSAVAVLTAFQKELDIFLPTDYWVHSRQRTQLLPKIIGWLITFLKLKANLALLYSDFRARLWLLQKLELCYEIC